VVSHVASTEKKRCLSAAIPLRGKHSTVNRSPTDSEGLEPALFTVQLEQKEMRIGKRDKLNEAENALEKRLGGIKSGKGRANGSDTQAAWDLFGVYPVMSAEVF
jgi:hypothetical protein